MDLLKRKPWLQALGVSAVVFVVYYVTRRVMNPYNQYALLADAFLHKRLWLVRPPPYLELARFGHKWFVIDPPAPTVFLLPFVAIFGKGTDNVLVSCGVGACAVGFFWVAATRLFDTWSVRIAMTVLVAFGTNFWWVSSDGGFWSFAHVSAVFFLMAGLIEATGRRRPWLVGLFVALAGLSRLPCFLIFPLYLYLVLDGDWRAFRKHVQFFAALGSGAAFYLGYNRARYGTFADRGYNHPQYLHEWWFAKGRFNIAYIPRHVRAIFYEWPHFSAHFPFVRPDYIGMALIFTTPMFLYAFRTKLDRRSLASLAALALVAVPLVTHGATGWSQFGYRYALDALPCLVLLTASGMRKGATKVAIALLSLSLLVNLWGTLAFNRFNWPV